MSRIHEALKKAEQERATVQAAAGGVFDRRAGREPGDANRRQAR